VYVVKPVTVTDAMLISTDVPENDYPLTALAASTAYTKGTRCMRTGVHKVYECSVDYTTAATPVQPENEPTKWLEVGPTNRWKCLDTSNSTQTSNATSMSYTIKPGVAVTCAAVLNVRGASVRIRVVDDTAGTVYDKTFSLYGVIPAPSWWDYFFATVRSKDQAIALDLPPYAQASIIVDVTADSSGICAAGVLMMGYAVELSPMSVKYGARASITDYSRKETNTWGDTVLAQRAYAKRREWGVEVPNERIDALERELVAVRATPCLWVGHSDFSVTTVFGFYKDWDITIAYPTFSECTLTIEGMT
jgi:hypothetical protein